MIWGLRLNLVSSTCGRTSLGVRGHTGVRLLWSLCLYPPSPHPSTPAFASQVRGKLQWCSLHTIALLGPFTTSLGPPASSLPSPRLPQPHPPFLPPARLITLPTCSLTPPSSLLPPCLSHTSAARCPPAPPSRSAPPPLPPAPLFSHKAPLTVPLNPFLPSALLSPSPLPTPPPAIVRPLPAGPHSGRPASRLPHPHRHRHRPGQRGAHPAVPRPAVARTNRQPPNRHQGAGLAAPPDPRGRVGQQAHAGGVSKDVGYHKRGGGGGVKAHAGARRCTALPCARPCCTAGPSHLGRPPPSTACTARASPLSHRHLCHHPIYTRCSVEQAPPAPSPSLSFPNTPPRFWTCGCAPSTAAPPTSAPPTSPATGWTCCATWRPSAAWPHWRWRTTG